MYLILGLLHFTVYNCTILVEEKNNTFGYEGRERVSALKKNSELFYVSPARLTAIIFRIAYSSPYNARADWLTTVGIFCGMPSVLLKAIR